MCWCRVGFLFWSETHEPAGSNFTPFLSIFSLKTPPLVKSGRENPRSNQWWIIEIIDFMGTPPWLSVFYDPLFYWRNSDFTCFSIKWPFFARFWTPPFWENPVQTSVGTPFWPPFLTPFLSIFRSPFDLFIILSFWAGLLWVFIGPYSMGMVPRWTLYWPFLTFFALFTILSLWAGL